MTACVWAVLCLLMGSVAAAPGLSVIKDCDEAYSSQKVDASTRSDLKRIDDLLSRQVLDNAAFRYMIGAFIRACRALGGDMTQRGPKMDDMINALHSLEQAKDPVSKRSHALARDPDLAFFNKTVARVATEYRQPACMANINYITVDILAESQELLDKSDIDCADPPEK